MHKKKKKSSRMAMQNRNAWRYIYYAGQPPVAHRKNADVVKLSALTRAKAMIANLFRRRAGSRAAA